MLGLLGKIIGTSNDRELKRLWPTVKAINALEPKISALSERELRQKTDLFREEVLKKQHLLKPQFDELEERFRESASPEDRRRFKHKIGLLRNQIFEGILEEAFAVVREASRRTVGMRHFDAQLLGGLVLHEGKIAEMATGEGKTLVATLPVYLNSFLGRGVHVVTVNDYLAKRDREWMGPIYESLGLSIGVIQHDLNPEERRKAYGSDVTYGTNNEFGFDYLRDNMVWTREDRVQRPLHYAIVDEVDSILIDEARTPLIISGPAEESTEKYYKIDRVIPRLQKETDYQVDEEHETVHLTEGGVRHVEELLAVGNLYEDSHIDLVHHVNQALRAHTLFKRDVDYMVKDNGVVIVDEFTGRLMPGRRWSDGLHQAIEAKEGVRIERENQTLATITFQNYFRMYEKLAGMTGTAATEAEEFSHIYKLEVVSVPTNRSLVRTNYPDVIYKTEREKFKAVVEEIAHLNQKGRPILVGTISIERSERLSDLLRKQGIPHQVLNARYHEMEARIVAQAGRKGAVTIATNMAGRGTDILLGGKADFLIEDLTRRSEETGKTLSEQEREETTRKIRSEVETEHQEVVRLGGLHIIGTERHEARRIDNQLRGRSGRQGDPGSSRFYLSLEDDLLRIFASDRIAKVMDFFQWEENTPIEHGMVTRSIEIAQRRVEGHHFEVRKQLLKFDSVMNRQREVIYEERRTMMEREDLRGYLLETARDVIEEKVDFYLNEAQRPEEWDMAGLCEWFRTQWGLRVSHEPLEGLAREGVVEKVVEVFQQTCDQKEKGIGPERMQQHARMILLQVVDSKWKDHLYLMDSLREGIWLRGYGQRDPEVEYRREAFELFEEMVGRIKEGALEFILKFEPVGLEKFSGVFGNVPKEFLHPETSRFARQNPLGQDSAASPETLLPTAPPSLETSEPIHRSGPKVGRNDPCPCGSGKKYKKCHGQ